MTFAEVLLLIVGGAGIYYLLRPIQQRLEGYFIRKLGRQHSRLRRPTLDVLDFPRDDSTRKDDDHQ